MRRSTLVRILGSMALLIACSGFAAAVDFGGTLDNLTAGATDIASGAFQIDQEDTITAWISAPIGKASRFYGEGFYKFTYQQGTVTPYLFDVSQFYISTDIYNVQDGPSHFGYQVGRIAAADMSGYVMNGLFDGMTFTLAYPSVEFTLSGGYTGLTLKPDSTVIMSRLDSTDLSNNSVILGPPRIVGSLEVRFPHLFALQSVSVDAIAQKDLHSPGDLISAGTTSQNVSSSGAVDTGYFGVQLAGPLTSTLFYSAFSYLNIGQTLSFVANATSPTGNSYQYEPILAYAGGLSLDLYPGFLGSHFGLSGLYSTGDNDANAYLDGNTSGASNTFIPINQRQYSLIFTPQLGNSILLGLQFSLKPFSGSSSAWLKSLQGEVKAFGYLRPATSEPTSVGATVASPGDPYLGTEIDAYLRVRPYSDLGFELQSGMFMPNKGQNGTPFPQTEPIAFRIGLRGVMSF